MTHVDDQRFRKLIEYARDLIVVTDERGNVLYASPSVRALMGYEPEEYARKNAWDYLHPDDVDRVADAFTLSISWNGMTPRPIEFRHRHADGSWRWLEATATNLLDDPSVGGVVYNARDITERKAYEEQLRHQAFHDALTDLPNRALLLDRLDGALARGSRQRAHVAVLYLDLDRFKFVNDSLGHDAGDQLLIEIGRRVRRCVRQNDMAARLAGDEFVIVLEDIEGTSEAILVAERIAEAMRAGFEVSGHEVIVTASIGIAIGVAGQTDAVQLLRQADTAMYRAKRRGQAGHAVFRGGPDSRALEQLELQADLRRGLARGDLRLHYQPVVDLGTGRVRGVEALLRWAHPRRGLLPPAAFIPMAEETGLIVPIGRWVLQEACRQAQTWRARRRGRTMRMFVNVSALQVRHPGLVAEVAEALSDAGQDASSLVLEITEDAAMEDVDAHVNAFRSLKELGVRLAIDDFGTGRSSLSQLGRLPVDVLKVDRSFVDRLGRTSDETAIVRAVIGLARSLRLEVIAEGIETPEQASLLRQLGCRLGQGYYHSRPLEAGDMGAVLATGRSVPIPA